MNDSQDRARLQALRGRCRKLPSDPGVYRMLGDDATVLYVGKARNLKRRVGSYFNRASAATAKIRALVAQVHDLEVTVTRNESEALVLESNLIKELKPRYNIVLRDDKSYPYIHITSGQAFPRIAFHRGARRAKGRYFGPFPNAGAVRLTLNLLQKLFRVRQCEDSFFRNRTRPCLQYQIGRCTAPCVGLIEAGDYAVDVQHAAWFIEGRGHEVMTALVAQMEKAAIELEFERAARLRDQIADLRHVQSGQPAAGGDCDVVACATAAGVGCVQMFFIRGGRNLGNKAFFPAHTGEAASAEILAAFLAQFYLAGLADRAIPAEILLGEPLPEAQWLEDALADRRGGRVTLRHAVRGARAGWVDLARQNAAIALGQRLGEGADYRRRLEALQEFLALPEALERIECFDVSHTRGEATVAACVVFGTDGPRNADYRRFNIAAATAGDDYAALHEALERRYSRVQREDGEMPQLVLIDGGKGQVRQGREVLQGLHLGDVAVVGIAKGAARKPGLETLIMHDGRRERHLPPDSAALHLLQQIRDEAHRFAITAHRQARAKKRLRSGLETIEGVGARRRQKLIQHFGGLRGVAGAGVDDLRKVPGISRQLAQKIYDVLHDTR